MIFAVNRKRRSYFLRFILWTKSVFFLLGLRLLLLFFFVMPDHISFEALFFVSFLSYILNRMTLFLFEIDLLYACFCSFQKTTRRTFPIVILFLLTIFLSSTIHFDNVTMKNLFSSASSSSSSPHFFSQCYNEIISCLFLTTHIRRTKPYTSRSFSIYIYRIKYEPINS